MGRRDIWVSLKFSYIHTIKLPVYRLVLNYHPQPIYIFRSLILNEFDRIQTLIMKSEFYYKDT